MNTNTTLNRGAAAKPFEDPAPPFNKWRGEMQAALKSSGIYAARSPGTGNKLTLRWRETREAVQPAAQPEYISREDWIEQAVRVYLIAGDTEDEARECAEYQWGELDMDDLADPYDTAMSDIEGRGPAPAPMSPANRLVAYSAATRLRELGFEWDATAEAWLQPAQPAPAPPPECETEAEKRAFAFGWFKALESERMKAESVQEDAALEKQDGAA